MNMIKLREKKTSKNKTVVQNFNEDFAVFEDSWNSGNQIILWASSA